MRSPWPPSFFVGNRRPEGLPGISRGQEIHQLLPQDPPGTHPYFISLFDTDRNIPFYSAYKVTPQQAPLIGKYSRKDVRGRNWRNPPGDAFVIALLFFFVRLVFDSGCHQSFNIYGRLVLSRFVPC